MILNPSAAAGEVIVGAADISISGDYRYTLSRSWDSSKYPVTWIMLNPSTADSARDDATIRRCMGFSRKWGAGGILVVNLFAYRTTDPKKLWSAEDPVGRRNDWILRNLESRFMTVAAWGYQNHPIFHARRKLVMEILRDRDVFCLGTTVTGEPRHPVRLARNTERELFQISW